MGPRAGIIVIVLLVSSNVESSRSWPKDTVSDVSTSSLSTRFSSKASTPALQTPQMTSMGSSDLGTTVPWFSASIGEEQSSKKEVENTNGIPDVTDLATRTDATTESIIQQNTPTNSSLAPVTTSFPKTNTTEVWQLYLSSMKKTNSCPTGCTCNAKSRFDQFARLTYPKSRNSAVNFTVFRNHVFPLAFIRAFGEESLVQHLTTYSLNIDCIAKNDSLFVNSQFESHFKSFNLENTRVNISVRCFGNNGVVWNSTSLRVTRLVVDSCFDFSGSAKMRTAPIVIQLLVRNSSGDWLQNFSLSNQTHMVGFLQITNTVLTEIPAMLSGKHLSLREIKLNRVNLSNFECSVLVEIHRLRHLELVDNQLTQLQECFFAPSLKSLNISHNLISHLTVLEFPKFVENKHLVYIDLCNNNIKDLKPFTSLNVAAIYLCNNYIERIARLTFIQLTELFILELQGNRISHIEAGSFRFLTALQFLDLSRNRLLALSVDTTPSAPCHIDISQNRLNYPPLSSTGFHPSSAVGVTADNNPYYCDCELAKFQEFIAEGQDEDFYNLTKKNFPVSFVNNRTYPRALFSSLNLRCHYPERLRGVRLLDVEFNISCPIVQNCPTSCQCDHRQGDVYVNCFNKSLISFPSQMPTGHLKLDLRRNQLTVVPFREYLSRTISLDLSNNNIQQVSPQALDALSQVRILDLRQNRIKTLPPHLTEARLPQIREIRLSGNEWECNCDSLWFSQWLSNSVGHVAESENITCSYPDSAAGERVLDLSWEKLGCETPSYVPLATSLGVFSFVVLLLIPLIYRFRWETKVFIHAALGVKPFDRHRHVPEGTMFDAFIAHSCKDDGWVKDVLLPRLGYHSESFRACVYWRDFIAGESIADNILMAIEKSQITVIVLSRHFVQSEWCLFEFQTAHQRLLEEGRCRLLAIVLEEPDHSKLSVDLKTYLKTNTFLSVDDRWFWQKLMYALPKPSKARRNANVFHSEQTSL